MDEKIDRSIVLKTLVKQYIIADELRFSKNEEGSKIFYQGGISALVDALEELGFTPDEWINEVHKQYEIQNKKKELTREEYVRIANMAFDDPEWDMYKVMQAQKALLDFED